MCWFGSQHSWRDRGGLAVGWRGRFFFVVFLAYLNSSFDSEHYKCTEVGGKMLLTAHTTGENSRTFWHTRKRSSKSTQRAVMLLSDVRRIWKKCCSPGTQVEQGGCWVWIHSNTLQMQKHHNCGACPALISAQSDRCPPPPPSTASGPGNDGNREPPCSNKAVLVRGHEGAAHSGRPHERWLPIHMNNQNPCHSKAQQWCCPASIPSCPHAGTALSQHDDPCCFVPAIVWSR